MATTVDADYLVVGAGATGMAFADALVDHADVRVVLVDRRHGPGGHWLDDYAFVRLHQASAFYGVASTLLGEGRVQQDGPEAGLYERSEPFEGREDGLTLIFQWHRLDRLAALPLYPTFLREALRALPEAIAHVVHSDNPK